MSSTFIVFYVLLLYHSAAQKSTLTKKSAGRTYGLCLIVIFFFDLEDQPKEILYAASAADKISGFLLQFDKFKDKEVLEKIDTKKNLPKSKLSEKQFNEFKKQAIDSLAKQGLMRALEKPRKHETVRTTPDKNGEYDVVANGKVVMHHKADKNSNSHERELER